MPEPTPNSPESESPENRTPQPPADGWELMCSGILQTEFGRRPTRAVSSAVMQLAAEEALAKPRAKKTPTAITWGERLRGWFSGFSLRPGLAFGAALAIFIVAGLAVWFFGSDWLIGIKSAPTVTTVCTLSDALDARWTGRSGQKVGETLSKGSYQLESGEVELTFASHARVAIEGPAQFKLTDGNSMELSAGKLSTDVPRQARGFSVKTPTATVVDLGTRFGAGVNSNRVTQVAVFQGRVELTKPAGPGNPGGQWRLSPGMAMVADGQRAAATAPLPEGAFPQPGQIVLARPQNCGFDALTRAPLGEIPNDFGYWRGPAYALTRQTQGIRPFSGTGMLQFLEPTPGQAVDSEVWQLIDLRPFKDVLAGGMAEGKLSAFFNHLKEGGRGGEKFGLALAAFAGRPADAKSLWERRSTAALAQADKQLTADDDPATWEKIEVTAKLPAEADFVIISLRAVAPASAAGKTPLFPGHFADLVDLKLCTPMRLSSTGPTR